MTRLLPHFDDSGQVEIDGVQFNAREEAIEPGRGVVVTGFGPSQLFVREMPPEEFTATNP